MIAIEIVVCGEGRGWLRSTIRGNSEIIVWWSILKLILIKIPGIIFLKEIIFPLYIKYIFAQGVISFVFVIESVKKIYNLFIGFAISQKITENYPA